MCQSFGELVSSHRLEQIIASIWKKPNMREAWKKPNMREAKYEKRETLEKRNSMDGYNKAYVLKT